MTWLCIAAVTALIAPQQPGFTPVPLETVSGVIELVHPGGLDGCEVCDACDDCRGVHVVVRTRSRRVEVHLAPAWYLARFEYMPAIGDEIRVIGSRTRVPKRHGLAAHEVYAGELALRLRDEYGLPLWRRFLTDD